MRMSNRETAHAMVEAALQLSRTEPPEEREGESEEEYMTRSFCMIFTIMENSGWKFYNDGASGVRYFGKH